MVRDGTGHLRTQLLNSLGEEHSLDCELASSLHRGRGAKSDGHKCPLQSQSCKPLHMGSGTCTVALRPETFEHPPNRQGEEIVGIPPRPGGKGTIWRAYLCCTKGLCKQTTRTSCGHPQDTH